MKNQHTQPSPIVAHNSPLPWEAQDDGPGTDKRYIYSTAAECKGNGAVAVVYSQEFFGGTRVGMANADLIVRAVNSHAALVEACEALENVFAATERAKAGLRDFAVCDLTAARKQARAALALAKGDEA